MFAQESVMDIQKEKIAHEKHLLSQGVDFKYLPNIQYSELENVYELIEWDEEYSEALNEINSSWCTWLAAKAQAVPEGRTDFEIINQTIELVDLLALSTNFFQRDPKSKVHPFESENPRVMEWWRTACQIQELLTNTDPDNCDFEEYKAMIEAQEPTND